MKPLRFILLAILLIPLGLILLLFSWKWIDNLRFARKFFDDKVEIVRVIASKRWLDMDESRGCTYAVVEFSEESAAALRDDGPKALVGKGWRRGGLERWNLYWQPTPIDGRTQYPRRPFVECLKHLPGDDAKLIMHGLQSEGSWYFQGLEIATFLSAESRIAATLWYGY